MMKEIKNKKRAFCMIILSVATLCAGGLRAELPLQEDSCIYLSLAEAVGKGLGYAYTAEPIDRPANYHPPGYTMLLLPVVCAFPKNYVVPRILGIVLTLILIGIFFYSFRLLYKDDQVVLMSALLAFNGLLVFYSRQILTEIPYVLFSFLAVYSLEYYRQNERLFNRSLFFAAFAMAIAFYMRSIGITLVIAVLIYFVFQRKMKKGLTLGFLFFILVLPWLSYSMHVSKNAYVAEFESATQGIGELLRRGIYNLAATVGKELPDLFFYPFFTSIDPRSFVFIFKFLLGASISGMLLYGFLKKIQEKGVWFFDVYSLVYFCFYLSWTHHGARYLVPLLPFLLYYLFWGIKSVLKRESLLQGVIVLIIFLNIAGGIKEIIRERNNPYRQEERSFIQAVDWIKKNVSPKSIILSRRNNWVYAYTEGLRGVRLLRTSDTREHYTYIINNKVDYIVIDQNKIYRDDARDYLLPLVRNYPDSFTMVYVNPQKPETYVYKVNR